LSDGVNEKGAVVGLSKVSSSGGGGVPPVVEADDSQEWLVNKMSNDAAKGFLEGKETGTFFVRDHEPEKGTYALTVIMDGKVSHHKLAAPDGKAAKVGKTELPAAGLSAAIMHLRVKHPYWPVALKDHLTVADVEVAEEAEEEEEEETPPPRPAKPAATSDIAEEPAEAFPELNTHLSALFKAADLKDTQHTAVPGEFLDRAELVFRLNKDDLKKLFSDAGVMHHFDKDGDGKLSFTDLVQTMDADNDGTISLEEFLGTAMEKMKSKGSAAAPAGGTSIEEPWLHEKMSNDDAGVLLQGKGNGTFLVREHTPADGVYALSVVYKDKPTHHKVVAPAGEKAKVNKAATPAEGIVEVVAHLREMRKYWPVPLKVHIEKAGAAPAASSKAAPAEEETVAPLPTKSTDGATDSRPWLHEKMTNDEASIFLENKTDGVFMVREHTPAEGVYAMSVVYKGKATHHKIRAAEGTNAKINTAETPATSIDELVEHLREKRKYWPVPLLDHISKLKTRGSIKRRSVKKKGKGSVKSKRASMSIDDGKQLWLHPKLHNDDAGAMLAGKADGHFLVRMHTPADSMYALSVVYKGKPTHHKIQAPDGEDATVGKSKVPVQGISAVVTHLRSKHPYWPVALKDHVPGSAKSDGTEDPDAWLHPKMSNDNANSLLGDGSDGTFIIRDFKPDEQQYVISVKYNGKPTHHLLNAKDGKINKKIDVTTGGVADVVAQLRSPMKGWPVALTTHIPASINL
jgi:hypothetical protein